MHPSLPGREIFDGYGRLSRTIRLELLRDSADVEQGPRQIEHCHAQLVRRQGDVAARIRSVDDGGMDTGDNAEERHGRKE
ncbi:hypothetical protein V6N13_066485 [Hibiscus sabdariffa]|uniref:Uncharacterized protein n=1 Tax=Hibiscus sabdariffa TaxID=183260 RepID=A0ABR2DRW2_9ROSI